MYKDNDVITLVVCHKTLKVGCVLVQATFGFQSNIVSELFYPETWVLAPEKTLVPIRMSYIKWRSFAEIINRGEASRMELLEKLPSRQ